jgi:hypothetical protein
MKVLASFEWDCGRMGVVEGLFITDEDSLAKAYGKEVYFGEILGKHSDISGAFHGDSITIKSKDQDFIDKLESVIGSKNISGYNPLDYIEQCV